MSDDGYPAVALIAYLLGVAALAWFAVRAVWRSTR